MIDVFVEASVVLFFAIFVLIIFTMMYDDLAQTYGKKNALKITISILVFCVLLGVVIYMSLL